MENPLQPCDELFLFMLNWLHLRHTVVFTKTCPWSTIHTCESMSDDQPFAESDLKLVYLRQDIYGELKEKPVLYSQAKLTEDNDVPSTQTVSNENNAANNRCNVTSKLQASITSAAKLVEDEKLKHHTKPEDSTDLGHSLHNDE